jgi:Predicted AAA-ATPase/PD-(D/E)XK nuclease superfamily
LIALQEIGDDYGISLVSKSPGTAFKELIKKVAIQTGKQVVVLIDEYDKPIIDYIDPFNLKKAQSQRDILKHFFGILKFASKDIRLLLITGVSKFARVSIFSELNHLVDLTLLDEFAALCGYTEAELTHHFKGYLEKMPPDTLEKMRSWYDGYSWDGQTFVYNPFSVLNFFLSKTYSNFWFVTGTPTLLVNILRHRFIYKLEQVEVNNLILDTFILEEIGDLNITSLLLQSGYLTIKEITPYGAFVLNYPNEEVKRSFGQFLLREYTKTSVNTHYSNLILTALDMNNIQKVIMVLHDLIQAVPDHNYINDEEKFVHAIVHLIFTMVGTDVRSEVHTPAGRIDTVIITKERIFLFEFKMSGTPEEAIKYMVDKNYPAHLRHRGLPITGIGVVFSLTKKGVESWDKAEL